VIIWFSRCILKEGLKKKIAFASLYSLKKENSSLHHHSDVKLRIYLLIQSLFQDFGTISSNTALE
jgi:hypothetical protein